MTATTRLAKLGIRKITARIGAEVTGLSPDLALDPETLRPSARPSTSTRRSSSAG